MTTTPLMDFQTAQRIVRDALKDKSYRSTPLGLEVARYIRWKKNEWGAAKDTIRDYEPILAKLCQFFPDLELKDLEAPVGAERLRECWDHYWGDRTGRTRAKVLSVWRDFFDWAVREQRGVHGNPARILTSPKKRGVKRDPFAGALVDRVIAAQAYLGDKLGVILILQYALRRAELASIRFQDFDFERRQVTFVGKGGKVRTVPIIDEAFWRDLGAFELELGGHETCREWFLICPKRTVGMNVHHFHHKGFVPRSVSNWWYDRLEEAGLVGDRESGTRKGLGMHRGRHTVATDLLRHGGNLAAAQALLGHADIKTTIESYAAFDTADLERAMRDSALIKAQRAEKDK